MEGTGALAPLSAELREQVFGAVEGFPIGMAEAKELRGRLMQERSDFVDKQDRAFQSSYFSLCEH